MKRAALVVAVLVLWAVAGCQTASAPKPPPPPAKKNGPPMANGGPRVSGRAFLVGSQPEKPGYALYSYLLLGGPPDDTTRERYRAAALAFLGKIVELDKIEREFSPGEINVVYLPVESPLSFTPPPDAAAADRLLASYNYARARALLRAVPGAERAGPYIVSHRMPLTGAARLEREYLFQDLSAVPPDVIRFWVDIFLRQTAQERFWEERRMEQLALELRTEIEKVAGVVPGIKDALTTWLVWVK